MCYFKHAVVSEILFVIGNTQSQMLRSKIILMVDIM